tara:strand:- start:883 stop:1635 length:753 start_codon:yes stop_codon:yes gene_type:complete
MKYILFIISFNAFSQLSLPTFQSIHNNQESGNILQDNLILHLDASNPSSLDPNDLTIWNDLSSSNNDLPIFQGSTTFSNSDGGSLVFDGNDIYKINNLNNLTTQKITISFWIKTNDSSGYLACMSRTPNNITNELIFMISGGKLHFWDYSNAYGFNTKSNSTVHNNQWKFVTFVKDNTSGKYYINTTLDRSITAARNVPYGSDNFLIGKNWRDNNHGYSGNIGAVYFYTTNLSISQIEDNFIATKSRYGL